MDILKALRAEQSKYFKLADYAIQQLDTIQAAIKLVEADAANKSVTGKVGGSRQPRRGRF